MSRPSPRWPIVTALATFGGSIAFLVVWATRGSAGRFFYALDDAYIHMAIARNISRHGVWGVMPDRFSSSSSSLLWPLLLALADRVAGSIDWAPFVLNLVFGVLLLVVCDGLVVRRAARLGTAGRAGVLLAILFAAPLPALVLSGMEHVLQVLVVVVFAWRVSDGSAEAPSGRRSLELCLLASLMTAVRYEGLFVVLAASILLAWNRQFARAIAIGLCALLPPLVYAVLSIRNGWSWAPNSLLLKGFRPDLSSPLGWVKLLGGHAAKNLLSTPSLLAIVIAVGAALALVPTRDESGVRERFLARLFLGATAIHLQVASVDWLYRYEAYLMVLGVLSLAGLLAALGASPGRVPVKLRMALAVLVVATLGLRSTRAISDTSEAIRNRYVKHRLPAEFIARYVGSDTVVVNDVGLVAWFTPARILDIYGLASVEPSRFAKSAAGYGPAEVAAWVEREKGRIAVLETGWPLIAALVPPSWTPVGRWHLPRDVVFGDDLVGFYAVDRSEAPRLARALKDFAAELPSEVRQELLTGFGGP